MDRLDEYLTREDPSIADDEIECPHCGALLDEDVYHASSQDTLQVYRCPGCGRYTTEREIVLATEVDSLKEQLRYALSSRDFYRMAWDNISEEYLILAEILRHKGE